MIRDEDYGTRRRGAANPLVPDLGRLAAECVRHARIPQAEADTLILACCTAALLADVGQPEQGIRALQAARARVQAAVGADLPWRGPLLDAYQSAEDGLASLSEEN